MYISLNGKKCNIEYHQGSVFGPLLFLIYINDLSKSVSDKSSPILFPDDTSFIIVNRDKDKFKFNTNEIFNEINKWFCSNLLPLNYEKTYFLQFSTKTDYKINMQVSFGDRKIDSAQSLKFFGLTIDITVTWKHHINRLTPNDPYMGRTAPLTSKRCILYIYSTNIGTEYFKHALYSPFFFLQNAVCFIMLTCLVSVLFTFYIQGVLKLKK